MARTCRHGYDKKQGCECWDGTDQEPREYDPSSGHAYDCNFHINACDCYAKQRSDADEAIAAMVEMDDERKAWKELAELQDLMLRAYRVGKRPAEKTLDRIVKLRAQIKERGWA